jgi:hypothetical protein
MRVPYMVGRAQRPQPALGGSLVRPRPMMPVQFSGPGGSVTRTSVLDTGADDTVLPEWIAAAIGLDLTGVQEYPIGLAGRAPLQCRYVPVEMQISDGVHETYRWTAVVGFVDAQRLPRPLLGHAGFLQYFDADFRGADLEVILVPNRSFTSGPGRHGS